MTTQLEKLISWCKNAEPINWIRATDIAYGLPGDNTIAYERQPGDVRIYNPENLPLSEILVHDTELIGLNGEPISVKGLSFDQISCAGMHIFLPYFYTLKEGIINGCPKCATKTNKKTKLAKSS